MIPAEIDRRFSGVTSSLLAETGVVLMDRERIDLCALVQQPLTERRPPALPAHLCRACGRTVVTVSPTVVAALVPRWGKVERDLNWRMCAVGERLR